MLNFLKEINAKEYSFSRPTSLALYFLIFTLSGVFGFLYEEVFYFIDLGYLVKRGTTFGPWIPIYSFGALLILFTTRKLKAKPWAVFLLAVLVTGILEFGTGYVLYHFFGLRLWDYNTEIWNWGNIGGFICFRSVTFFGICALILTYLLKPILSHIAENCEEKRFRILAAVLTVLYVLDIIISLLYGALVA